MIPACAPAAQANTAAAIATNFTTPFIVPPSFQ
jgi:hypothetical protein